MDEVVHRVDVKPDELVTRVRQEAVESGDEEPDEHRGQLGDGARIATRIVPADAPDLHTLLDDPAFQRRLVAGVSPLLCPPEDLESLAAAPGRSLPSRGRSLA